MLFLITWCCNITYKITELYDYCLKSNTSLYFGFTMENNIRMHSSIVWTGIMNIIIFSALVYLFVCIRHVSQEYASVWLNVFKQCFESMKFLKFAYCSYDCRFCFNFRKQKLDVAHCSWIIYTHCTANISRHAMCTTFTYWHMSRCLLSLFYIWIIHFLLYL